MIGPEFGRLRLVSGEEFILGGQFEFESWTNASVILRRGAARIAIPEADVLSLTLAKKSAG